MEFYWLFTARHTCASILVQCFGFIFSNSRINLSAYNLSIYQMGLERFFMLIHGMHQCIIQALCKKKYMVVTNCIYGLDCIGSLCALKDA